MITQNQLKQLLVIILIWVLAGVLTALYEYFFLVNYPGVFEASSMENYSLIRNMIAAAGGLFVGSVLYGLMEFFFFQRKTKREKFYLVIGKKFLVYSLFLAVLLFGISLIYNSILSGRSLASSQAWTAAQSFLFSKAILHPVIPILLLALFTSFFIQLSERFGADEMWKMFSGRYFNPVEEARIFMFLDLNSSTTLAEQLGNEKFYSFLNDFYHDIAPVITKYKGDVVEYVGDQVVITWSMPKGVFRARCMACFQEFEKAIASKSEYYLEKYAFIPSFKAAVHCGEVMIGEMGKLKKTIKYSGDVLNTTARVEKLCGDIGAKMVVTEPLVQEIENQPFILEKIKDVSLKGKENRLDVYRVDI